MFDAFYLNFDNFKVELEILVRYHSLQKKIWHLLHLLVQLCV